MVAAADGRADRGQRRLGVLLGQIHGDLPRLRDLARPLRRVEPFGIEGQVAAYHLDDVFDRNLLLIELHVGFENLFGQRRGDLPSEERRVGHQRRQRAFDLAHVGRDVVGEELHDLFRDLRAHLLRLGADDLHLRVVVGLVELGGKPPLETRQQTVLDVLQFDGRLIRREDQLLARQVQMIEDIEKCLNTKLKQEIYCPIDDKIEIEIIKICNNLKKSDFYKFGQKILCNILLKYGFKLNLLVNLKKADVNDIDGIITIRNKDSVINLSVDKSMVSDIRQYNMVHRYPNREYFFLNTKGKKITSSSALATIQEKLEEVNNINTTTLALKGVSKLIQKGLTLSEIKYLTGFETKKIEDVSRWLMNQEDVESVINNKLNLIDI